MLCTTPSIGACLRRKSLSLTHTFSLSLSLSLSLYKGQCLFYYHLLIIPIIKISTEIIIQIFRHYIYVIHMMPFFKSFKVFK